MQAIAAVSLTVWAATATLLVFMIVNRIIPIRLDPEDEINGCDLTEHYFNKNCRTEEQPPIVNKFDVVSNFVIDPRNRAGQDCYNRHKQFHVNHTFDRDNERY